MTHASKPAPVARLAARAVQTMTVLFADICGSTRLYTRLGDHAARRIVNAALDAIVGVLPHYRGRLVKTLGDEVMCVFSEAGQAVMAAMEMQARIAGLRPEGQPLEIHIGLHHGQVLCEGRDVYGDTVNAASYLRAVASAGQILTTETTVAALDESIRIRTRTLFYAVMKGNSAESAIQQVVWQTDPSMLTNVNLRGHNLVPPDEGGLLVCFDHEDIRIDTCRPELVIGRGPMCDLRVDDPFVSRRHAVLALRRTQVYLVDQSSNGSFVRRANGEVAHVFRSELLLDGRGEISLGRAFDQPPLQPLSFRRDRRALYRV